ncbi:MAG: hypothetical protein ACTIOG_06555 [Pseudomonas helleri]|uniref:hypothetical protein n=1 Tax=Pseudomonas helleri TaxID=1608996 RepID=UPI003F949F31
MQKTIHNTAPSGIKRSFERFEPYITKVKKYPIFLSVVLIGFISAQKLNLAGEIYIGEILGLIYILSNLRKINPGKQLKSLILIGLLWSLCQLISDQINETELLDSVKGVGTPLIFISTIVALSMFFMRNIRRTPSFLLGIYLGQAVQLVIFQNEYFEMNPWKWGIGQLTLGLFSTYFTFFLAKKRNLYLILFVISFSIIGLLNDSRSMAMFPMFATVAYIYLRKRKFGAVLKKFRGKFAITKLAFIIFSLLFLTNTIFTAVFSSDWVLEKLPAESAKKFKTQAGGEYGALLGGRNEMLVSTSAFLDKPLLGHGSWAKDKDGYHDKLAILRYTLGYAETNDSSYKSDLIPVHSYIMSALVWAGFAGGLFWLYIIRWLLIEFLASFEYLGFFFYNGLIIIMWDIMFSPFGANARWMAASFISAFYCYSKYISKNKVIK